LDKCKGRNDLSQSGVYFLFSTNDQTGENVVYVGQAGVRKNGEGILYRLQEHKRNPDKDYWTEAVVFTTSNNSFGPTEISYLENRFTNMAVAAKRVVSRIFRTFEEGIRYGCYSRNAAVVVVAPCGYVVNAQRCPSYPQAFS